MADEESLSNAEEIGGVVVTIQVDKSALNSAPGDVAAVRKEIEGTPATLQITGNAAPLRAVMSESETAVEQWLERMAATASATVLKPVVEIAGLQEATAALTKLQTAAPGQPPSGPGVSNGVATTESRFDEDFREQRQRRVLKDAAQLRAEVAASQSPSAVADIASGQAIAGGSSQFVTSTQILRPAANQPQIVQPPEQRITAPAEVAIVKSADATVQMVPPLQAIAEAAEEIASNGGHGRGGVRIVPNASDEYIGGEEDRLSVLQDQAAYSERLESSRIRRRSIADASEAEDHEEFSQPPRHSAVSDGGEQSDPLEAIATDVANRRRSPGASTGRGRSGGIGFYGRMIGGMAIQEGADAIFGLSDYNRDVLEAGDDQSAVLKAQLTRHDRLTSSGLIGRGIGFFEDPTGSNRAALDLAEQSGNFQEKHDQLYAKNKEQLTLLQEQSAEIATGGGFAGKTLSVQNRFADTERSVKTEQDSADADAAKDHKIGLALADADKPSIWRGVLSSITGDEKYHQGMQLFQKESSEADNTFNSAVAQNKELADSRMRLASSNRDVQLREVATQRLVHDQGMNARITTAQQRIASHDEEAGFTPQIAQEVSSVELAAPEDRTKAKQAAGLELEAMRHRLTGYHGGGISVGTGDNGEAMLEVLQARSRGPQDAAISAAISNAQQQVIAWNGDPILNPDGTITPAPGSGSTGSPNSSQVANGSSEHDRYRAAAAKRGPIALAAYDKNYAKQHQLSAGVVASPKPFKSNIDAMEKGLLEAKLGTDGMYHGSDAKGSPVTLTKEQYQNATAAAKKRQQDGPVDNLAPRDRGQRHATATMKGGYEALRGKLSDTIIGPDGMYHVDQSAHGESGQDTGSLVGVSHNSPGMKAVLTPDQYARMRSRMATGGPDGHAAEMGNGSRPAFLDKGSDNAVLVSKEHERYRAAAAAKGPQALAAYDKNYAAHHPGMVAAPPAMQIVGHQQQQRAVPTYPMMPAHDASATGAGSGSDAKIDQILSKMDQILSFLPGGPMLRS